MNLRSARISTVKRTAGLELPACFVTATINAAINANERTTKSAKASRRRLTDKATRLTGVEVAS